MWEELVIFNENFDYLTQEDPPVVIFFEVSLFSMLISQCTARITDPQ